MFLLTVPLTSRSAPSYLSLHPSSPTPVDFLYLGIFSPSGLQHSFPCLESHLTSSLGNSSFSFMPLLLAFSYLELVICPYVSVHYKIHDCLLFCLLRPLGQTLVGWELSQACSTSAPSMVAQDPKVCPLKFWTSPCRASVMITDSSPNALRFKYIL